MRCPVTGKLIDSFSPGEILEGKFEILRELARGGMGVVYVARHLALGRQVAVKVLLGELASDRELAARFEQEARAASAIGHPNIIHVYDLGRTAGGLLYMVMELLEGQSLAQLLADAGKLPISRAVRLIDQVLSALAAAHKNGIVHRDLKPDNIFVVQTEYQPDFVKLLDFGISKILAANAPGHLGKGRKETRMGTVMGTPEYMAPEQACGNVDQVDARTDLYATGIVLYELLSSQTPFTGDNYNAVMAAIIDGEHKRVRELRPSVTERLEQVIEQAIAAPREARFASAAAMRDALVAAQSDDPTRATGVAPVLELDDVDNEEPSGVYALGGAGTSDARPEPALELMPEVAPLPPPGAPTPVRPMAAQVAPRSAGSFMPASIGAAAAALAPPGAASGPRRDPFAAPDDAPESVLLLDSEVRRAHGTPRPQQLGTPVPAARVRATPLPGPAMRAPTASSSGLGRVLVWVVLVGALGTGGFLAFRRYKDRLPFGGTSISVPVAVTPAGAELRVDGQAVSGATVSLRQGKHELSAAAPGHVTRRFGFVAATGARVDVHLARGLAPVNAHDALLAGMLMPTPIAPAAAPTAADADVALAKLARVRECIEQVTDRVLATRAAEPTAVDQNLHWSLDAAAHCLHDARASAPPFVELDAAADADGAALERLATLLRASADARRVRSKPYRRDLAAAYDAAVSGDEALRRSLALGEEGAQQALLAALERDGGRGLGFAARRYVLAATAAWRRGEPTRAQAAYDELTAFCRPRHDCDALVLAAIAHQQQPGLESLNALVAAYDAATTD